MEPGWKKEGHIINIEVEVGFKKEELFLGNGGEHSDDGVDVFQVGFRETKRIINSVDIEDSDVAEDFLEKK